MRFTRTALVALMVGSLGMAACSDDDEDPTGPTISQFAGVWTASEVRYTSKSTPSRTLDITKVGGGLSMNISSTGTFTGTLTIPGIGAIPIKGDVELEGSNSADVNFDWSAPFDPNNPPIDDFTATYTLNNNTLVFTNPDADFQFPGQAAAEASVALITMTRASS